jgi:hypothetical protein
MNTEGDMSDVAVLLITLALIVVILFSMWVVM